MRIRIGHDRLTRCFQHRKRLLAANGWELPQELLQRVPALDVIEKRPHGNTRPYKDGGPAQDFRVTMSNASKASHLCSPSDGTSIERLNSVNHATHAAKRQFFVACPR